MKDGSVLLAKLTVLKEKKKGKDAVLAAYLLERRQEAAGMTIASVAEGCGVSYATVCRFLTKLGAGGFPECRRQLAQATPGDGVFLEPSAGKTPEETVQAVCRFSAEVVRSCEDVLCRSDLAGILTAMHEARHIQFLGLGASAVTAQYAYVKFFRLNLSCAVDIDGILCKMKASMLQAGDVLFAISSSGRTRSVVDCARMVTARGGTVICLSDFAHTPLGDTARHALCTTLRDSNKFVDTEFPLIQGQITLIDGLYACYCQRYPEAAARHMQDTRKAIYSDKIGM